MVIKLFLRPHSLPLFTLFPKNPSLPKLPIFSLSSLTSKTQTQTQIYAQIQIPDPENSYGPTLRKGTLPTPIPISKTLTKEEEDDDYVFNEESFTRVFEIAAIRVPSKDCFALESRLRGHLLNWPRIRNIARVPGDDIDDNDDELKELVRIRNEEDTLVSLNRRIYGKAEADGEHLSPVLYREKLVKTFDSNGFVNFRNLAKMTRPNRRKKKRVGEEEGGEGKKTKKKEKIGKNGFAVVEVVEDGLPAGKDLKGLLGEEFHGRKWRGPTRLLLLDERYSMKCAEELPEAIKVSVPTL